MTSLSAVRSIDLDYVCDKRWTLFRLLGSRRRGTHGRRMGKSQGPDAKLILLRGRQRIAGCIVHALTIPGTQGPSSVDPAEVAYYERLADLWWNDQAPFWHLNRLNVSRIRYVHDILVRETGRDAGAGRPLDRRI